MSWSVDDVMPGRDGPENLRILRKIQLKVDIGPCRQTSWVLCHWGIENWGGLDFRISIDRNLKHHKMRRSLGMVNIVRIVPLSSGRRTEVRS